MSGSHISDKKFVEAIKCPEGPQPDELLLIKILKKASGLYLLFNQVVTFTLFLPKENPCTTQMSLLKLCHQFLKLQKYMFQHEHGEKGLIS